MKKPAILDERTHVLFNLEVAQDFYLMRLQSPCIAVEAVPGQFVQVRVSNLSSPFLRIPLSICCSDREAGTVDLLYEDMGSKSHFLSQLDPGSEVSCLGPLGHGFSALSVDRRSVLVGGGIGVPPLLFMADVLQKQGHRVTLLVGARTAAKHLPDSMFYPASQKLHKATDDGSLGHHGLVTDLLRQELEEDGQCVVYTCGPHAMMAAVAAVCRDYGIPCQASLEEYMACGFGVCVGCVVEVSPPGDEPAVSPYMQYSRICVDGPVYDAHRVRW